VHQRQRVRFSGPWIVAAVLATVAGACDRADSAFDEPRRLYTLFEIEEAMIARRALPAGAAFPSGISPDNILAGEAGAYTLRITPAFSEGEPAAYVTTDLWVNFPEVWVQPWYVLITAWNEKAPRMNQLRDPTLPNMPTTPPIIDVGPKSAFYSPYWQIYFAVVPPDTAPDKYVSSRELISDNIPLYPGNPWFYTVKPTSIGLMMPRPQHPILGVDVGTLSLGAAALIEGDTVGYVNVGGNNFRFDDKLVVEEVPLFILTRRNTSGVAERLPPVRPGVPTPDVIGSSPLFSRRPAEVLMGSPRFGAFTRFYLAILPVTAAAFVPDAYPATVARLAALPTPIDPKIYEGRVALNGRKVAEADRDCFAEETFPASCRWMDSQQKIEDALGRSGIERTDVTASTPMVFYAGRAIGAR
jgi:hypothetical protein